MDRCFDFNSLGSVALILRLNFDPFHWYWIRWFGRGQFRGLPQVFPKLRLQEKMRCWFIAVNSSLELSLIIRSIEQNGLKNIEKSTSWNPLALSGLFRQMFKNAVILQLLVFFCGEFIHANPKEIILRGMICVKCYFLPKSNRYKSVQSSLVFRLIFFLLLVVQSGTSITSQSTGSWQALCLALSPESFQGHSVQVASCSEALYFRYTTDR